MGVAAGTIGVPAMEEVKPGTTITTITMEVEIIMLPGRAITTVMRERLGVDTLADTLKNDSIIITITEIGLSSTTIATNAAIALIAGVGFLTDGQIIIQIILIIAMSGRGRATVDKEELSSKEMRMVKM